MRNRFRRGESPAALVDDLLREIAKVEALTLEEATREPVAAAPESLEPGGAGGIARARGLGGMVNRRLLRWRGRGVRVTGLG